MTEGVGGLRKVVSGGQTGVDRAALDIAIELGIPCGGWIPKERRAEDGPLPPRYPVRETDSRGYAQRTRRNVRDSDGTLIVTRGTPTGGTATTIVCAEMLNRPYHVVDLESNVDLVEIQTWLRTGAISVLNVAGPRESSAPGIYTEASDLLRRLLTAS